MSDHVVFVDMLCLFSVDKKHCEEIYLGESFILANVVMKIQTYGLNFEIALACSQAQSG